MREIRKAINISIPFPENSKSIMDAVIQAVMEKARRSNKTQQASQLTFGFIENSEVENKKLEVTRAIDEAAQREKASTRIFAQNAIKASEIEEDLKESDLATGRPEDVETFVVSALRSIYGVQVDEDKTPMGYTLFTINLPPALRELMPDKDRVKISFYSPTPQGYIYIGRNHVFTEQICQMILSDSMERTELHDTGLGRTSVIKTKSVDIKTTLLLFRVRNVIEESIKKQRLVAEEMIILGYEGDFEDRNLILNDRARELMEKARPSSMLSNEAKVEWANDEVEEISTVHLNNGFDQIAQERAEKLIEAHCRFRSVVKNRPGKENSGYNIVEPVLPMDLMGLFILLPDKA